MWCELFSSCFVGSLVCKFCQTNKQEGTNGQTLWIYCTTITHKKEKPHISCCSLQQKIGVIDKILIKRQIVNTYKHVKEKGHILGCSAPQKVGVINRIPINRQILKVSMKHFNIFDCQGVFESRKARVLKTPPHE